MIFDTREERLSHFVGLASDPNLSPETAALVLSSRCPGAVNRLLENPALMLIVLEEPDFCYRVLPSHFIWLLSQMENIPEMLLKCFLLGFKKFYRHDTCRYINERIAKVGLYWARGRVISNRDFSPREIATGVYYASCMMAGMSRESLTLPLFEEDA